VIRIRNEVAWRAPPWVTERVMLELSEAMAQGERADFWATSTAADLDIREMDAAAFRGLQRALSGALDFVFVAGPRRFEHLHDFLDVVFGLSRLGLLLSLDPRSRDTDMEAAALEFVLTNAAAEFRAGRPSLGVLVFEAMPSKRGLAGLDRLEAAEREDLVKILQELRESRFTVATQANGAIRDFLATAITRLNRELREG